MQLGFDEHAVRSSGFWIQRLVYGGSARWRYGSAASRLNIYLHIVYTWPVIGTLVRDIEYIVGKTMVEGRLDAI